MNDDELAKWRIFMRACVLQWWQRRLRRCALKANRLSRSDLIEQSWFMTREDIYIEKWNDDDAKEEFLQR